MDSPPRPTRERRLTLGLLMAAVAAGAAVLWPYVEAARSGARTPLVVAAWMTMATLLIASPFVLLWRRSAPREGRRPIPSSVVWPVVLIVAGALVAYLAAIGEL